MWWYLWRHQNQIKRFGPGLVTYDFLNLKAIQSWRGGENFCEYTRKLLRLWNCAERGICLWVVLCMTLVQGRQLQLFHILFLNEANEKFYYWCYFVIKSSLMLYNAQILCFRGYQCTFFSSRPCSDQSAMTHIHLLRDIEYIKFAHLQTIIKRTDGLKYLWKINFKVLYI